MRITNTDIQPLVHPDNFVNLEKVTHLCTGGEAPWLKTQEKVFAKFAQLKGAGYDGRSKIYAIGERCRQRMGELWEAPAHRIAFMPSAAEGMNWLARGLDWQEGDNVVTTNLEFPSVAYAWKHLRSQGVEIRLVPHSNWIVNETDLLNAIDERTRVLAVSHVSFYTGQCLNLEQLSAGIRNYQTLFAVDATHSSGVVEVTAELTDLTVSSSYKWMLGTHGVAPCYFSERAETETKVTCFGWHNLSVWPEQGAERLANAPEKPMPEKLEPGNPAMLVVMHLDQALEILLSVGITKISDHARSLSKQVSNGLKEIGFTVISPQNYNSRSGNTCFQFSNATKMQNQLAEQGILCWGEYGRVRISTHLYNGSNDVKRFLGVLSELQL